MRAPVVAALVLVLAVACGAEDDAGSRAVSAPAVTPPATVPAAPAATVRPTRPSVIGPPRSPSVQSADPCVGGADALDHGVEVPPTALIERLDFVLASPLWGDVERSVSVWIDGYGEVLATDADRALLPASNQKIYTALGVALTLDPAARLTTAVYRQGEDLLLVASGDPTLRDTGPHSLTALAEQVAAADAGPYESLILDVSAFEAAATAPGWLDYQLPAYVGPMSAFMVDDNRHRTDAAFVRDPAVENGRLFIDRLQEAGVWIVDEVAIGGLDDGELVAEVASPTVAELVDVMMTASDNEVAESLLRWVGDGSTTGGTERIDGLLDEWCLGLTGIAGDGSGLGRASWRSAREWRRLLQVAADRPFGPDLRDAMPVAGRTGTLADRFTGTPAAGRVEAKTGSIIGGRSLSGYATTAEGREVVFSIVINGDADQARVARDAIDGLVNAVVAPLG